MRRGGMILCALALFLGVVLWGPWRDAPGDGLIGGHGDEERDEAGSGSAMLSPDERLGHRQNTAAGEEASGPAKPQDTVTTDPILALYYCLVVDLQGPVRPAPDTLTFELINLGRSKRDKKMAPAAYDGASKIMFSLDALTGSPLPETLRLAVRAPGIVGVVRVLTLAELPSGKNAAGLRTLRTTLTLRVAKQIQGRVVDRRGEPIPEADLEVFAQHGERIAEERYATTETDAYGKFRLDVAPDDPSIMVVSTQQHAPLLVRHREFAAQEEDVPLEFTLQDGLTVEGRVLWEGAPIDPAEGSEGWAVDFETETPIEFGDWGLDPDGQLHRSYGSVAVEPDGGFRATGLTRWPHRFTPDGEYEDRPVDWAIVVAASRTATPPSPVVIDLRPAWMDIAVRGDGEPLKEVALGVESETSGWWVSPAEDSTWRDVRIPLAPGLRYTLDVEAPGYEEAQQVHDAPAAGESITVRFNLLRPQKRSSLRVRFGGGEPGMTNFRLSAVDADGAQRPDVPIQYQRVKPTNGQYELQVAPGRWQIQCRPGRASWGSRPGIWSKIVRVVDVPEQGVSVELPLESGGLLRVHVRNAKGDALPAMLRVRDREGAALPVTWLVPRRGEWQDRPQPTLDANGTGWSQDPVPPGRYALVVSLGGYETHRQEVEIELGKTTVVEATLERSR